MPWRSQGVIALVIAVASNSALAQQESSAWPSRPQVVLAPSTSAEPSGAMNSLRIFEDMGEQDTAATVRAELLA